MNRPRSLNISVLLGAVSLMVVTVACGPRVTLKNPTAFKATQIRTLSVGDSCQLQEWFDTRPAPNKLVTQVGIAAEARNGFPREYGTTSYRITDSRQQGMFMMLLRRYYRFIPSIAMRSSFKVEVDFHRVAGKVRMQPGTTIRLSAAGRSTQLAYHPCIGEFLLNRDLYKSRRRYVVSTVVEGSHD